MTRSQMQHVVPSGLVLAVAAVITWLSFTQEPAGAFLFPRVISVAFLLLAALNFAQTLIARADGEGALTAQMVINLAPGLVIMLIYVFFLARFAGFYAGSAIVFLVTYALYDPVPLTDGKGWPKRIFVTAGFMAVIYVLFALVLKVQTPRGLLF